MPIALQYRVATFFTLKQKADPLARHPPEGDGTKRYDRKNVFC